MDRCVKTEVAYIKAGMDGLASEFKVPQCNVYSLGWNTNLDPRPLWRLRAILKQGNYDILHTHLPRADLYGVLATMMSHSSIKIISTKHNQHDFLKRQPYRLLGQLAARREDHAIAISNSVRRYYLDLNLVTDPNKISVIHYGIETNVFWKETRCPAKPTVPDKFGRIWVGTVARLTEQKGLSYLIEAIPIIITQEPRCHFVIIGQGEEEAALRQQVQRLNVEHAVTFAGFQENVAPWMEAMDIFVLPSLWEGLGRVLLEAMSLSLPIVASNVGPIPEVVSDGKTGHLVPPRDPQALAAAILRLVGAPEERRTMGQAGLKRVQHEFSIEKMVAKTTAVYRQCLGN